MKAASRIRRQQFRVGAKHKPSFSLTFSPIGPCCMNPRHYPNLYDRQPHSIRRAVRQHSRLEIQLSLWRRSLVAVNVRKRYITLGDRPLKPYCFLTFTVNHIKIWKRARVFLLALDGVACLAVAKPAVQNIKIDVGCGYYAASRVFLLRANLCQISNLSMRLEFFTPITTRAGAGIKQSNTQKCR